MRSTLFRSLLVLALVLPTLFSPSELLCVGEDGHVALEQSVNGICSESDHNKPYTQSSQAQSLHTQSRHTESPNTESPRWNNTRGEEPLVSGSLSHCGVCVDIPLTADFLRDRSISREAFLSSAQNGPTPDVLIYASIFARIGALPTSNKAAVSELGSRSFSADEFHLASSPILLI